jgi:mono/diheme cytochrome c family protein
MKLSWSPLAVALALVACSRPVVDATDGSSVFAAYCATCHGPDGRPPAAMAARLGVRDLTAPEWRARATVEVVERQVRKGSENRLMPGFEGAISDAEIKAVAAWVASPAFAAPR